MAAKQIGKAINWSQLLDSCAPESRPVLSAFKLKLDSYAARTGNLPEKAPAIQWDAYKSQLKDKTVVDALKKSFDAVIVKKPENTMKATIALKREAYLKEIATLKNEKDDRISLLKEKASKYTDLKPWHEMTYEEVNETFPETSMDLKKYPNWPHAPLPDA